MVLTDHFADVFVCENVPAPASMTLWRRNNVRKFDADANLYILIQCT